MGSADYACVDFNTTTTTTIQPTACGCLEPASNVCRAFHLLTALNQLLVESPGLSSSSTSSPLTPPPTSPPPQCLDKFLQMVPIFNKHINHLQRRQKQHQQLAENSLMYHIPAINDSGGDGTPNTTSTSDCVDLLPQSCVGKRGGIKRRLKANQPTIGPYRTIPMMCAERLYASFIRHKSALFATHLILPVCPFVKILRSSYGGGGGGSGGSSGGGGKSTTKPAAAAFHPTSTARELHPNLCVYDAKLGFGTGMGSMVCAAAGVFSQRLPEMEPRDSFTTKGLFPTCIARVFEAINITRSGNGGSGPDFILFWPPWVLSKPVYPIGRDKVLPGIPNPSAAAAAAAAAAGKTTQPRVDSNAEQFSFAISRWISNANRTNSPFIQPPLGDYLEGTTHGCTNGRRKLWIVLPFDAIEFQKVALQYRVFFVQQVVGDRVVSNAQDISSINRLCSVTGPPSLWEAGGNAINVLLYKTESSFQDITAEVNEEMSAFKDFWIHDVGSCGLPKFDQRPDQIRLKRWMDKVVEKCATTTTTTAPSPANSLEYALEVVNVLSKSGFRMGANIIPSERVFVVTLAGL
jgi:hypothetical protein